MRLILSVAAIRTPLTGIGRYTWELAKRTPSLIGPDAVRFLAGNRWVPDVDRLLRQSEAKLAARRRLTRSRVAVAAYSAFLTWTASRRLREMSDWLFHGPNFYLPKFPGRAVATMHDLSIYRFPQFHPAARVDYMKREIPKALARADFLITDSEFVRRELIELFDWPADKVRAVPLGVTADYHPRRLEETREGLGRYGLSHGGYTLCVATIEPRKNIDTLLHAYWGLPAGLRSRYPLVLVGDRGWHSETIHRRMEQARSEGWLHYLGYVPEADLPVLYAGARAFAYPSFYEGFGLPVIEAMASGLPVLISNRSSLPEVARDSARIVEAEDKDGLTAEIRLLLEDESWRDRAMRRAQEVAVDYSWEMTARKTVDVYRYVETR